MRWLLLSRVPILLPWSSRTTEFFASANSFLFSSWGRSCAIAIIIPKKVETIASRPRPSEDDQQAELLDPAGLGLARAARADPPREARGRRLAGAAAVRGAGLRDPGRDPLPQCLHAGRGSRRSARRRRGAGSGCRRWKACRMAEPRRATPLFCGWCSSTDSKSTSASSPPRARGVRAPRRGRGSGSGGVRPGGGPPWRSCGLAGGGRAGGTVVALAQRGEAAGLEVVVAEAEPVVLVRVRRGGSRLGAKRRSAPAMAVARGRSIASRSSRAVGAAVVALGVLRARAILGRCRALGLLSPSARGPRPRRRSAPVYVEVEIEIVCHVACGDAWCPAPYPDPAFACTLNLGASTRPTRPARRKRGSLALAP